MKLYSGPLSLFSTKARIALGEKGLSPELVQVAWSRRSAYAPHHPDVMALNPQGQVPILVEDRALDGRDHLCGVYSVADIGTFVFTTAAAARLLAAEETPPRRRLPEVAPTVAS